MTPIPAHPLLLTGDGTPSHLALPVARVVRRPAGRSRLAGEIEGAFQNLERDLERAREALRRADQSLDRREPNDSH